MKWIGQHIYDLISRFRSDVYLEDVSTGTIASGGNLGLDSNNKIVKAVSASGDLTSIIAGTGLSGTDLTGPIPTLNVDAAQTGITSLGTLSSLQVDNINLNGKDITVSGDSSGDEYSLILDSNGAVVLATVDSDGEDGHIYIKPDGDLRVQTKTGQVFFGDLDNNHDYCLLTVGADGDTTIQTVDAAGTSADLTLNIDGKFLVNSSQMEIDSNGAISKATWSGGKIADTFLSDNTAHLDTDQTFTGTKTLNSFKGTAGATVTNILDEDAMGSDSATALATQQSIKAYADRPAKQIVLKNFNFVASSGTTETFFPFAGTAEKTSDTDAAIVMIAPTAGKLLKLYMRASRDHSGQTTTITLYNWDADEAFSSSNKSSLGVQSATGPNTNEVVTFDFTSSLDSGTNAFTALETLAISYDNASAIGGGNTKYFFTAVFEYDFSGY